MSDPLLEVVEGLLRAPRSESPEPDDKQIQVATAVLLVQTIRADERIQPEEHRSLAHTLQRVLGFSAEEAGALVRMGEQQVARGSSFAEVVGVIARCSDDLKKKVVHALWRVAFADAELTGSEEYLVRKIAEHIELSTADLVETKLRAREEFLKEDL